MRWDYDATSGKLTDVTYPTDVTLPLSTATSHRDYSGTGQLNSVSSPGGDTVTYGYQGSLLTDVKWLDPPSRTLHRRFNADLRVDSEKVNGASEVQFVYDNDGLTTHAKTTTPAKDETVVHDPANGRLAGTTLGTITDAYTYDPDYGELNSYAANAGASSLLSIQYEHDDLGRIKTKTETVQGDTPSTKKVQYEYDAVGRLRHVLLCGTGATAAASICDGASAHLADYDYDDNGNRLWKNGTIGGTFDAQDRMTDYGANTYFYTPNGEITDKFDHSVSPTQHTQYVYDALGNLKSVALPDGRTVSYVVDGENRRVWRMITGGETKGWVFKDDLHIVAEVDAGGTVKKRFVYGSRVNVPDFMVAGGNVYRIISDHLGSPRLVVDASGQVVQRRDYDEFGVVDDVLLPDPTLALPFGFAGGLHDGDTGLVRFGARDYDAETGRWTAKDSLRFDGGGTNLYAYVANDPINQGDANGKGIDNFIRCLQLGGDLGLCAALGWAIPDKDPDDQPAPSPGPLDPPPDPTHPPELGVCTASGTYMICRLRPHLPGTLFCPYSCPDGSVRKKFNWGGKPCDPTWTVPTASSL